MTNPSVFTELEVFSFHRIVMAHTLISDNYSFTLDNSQNSIYGELPENCGVLEIGFVEENPLEITCPLGDFLLDENSIFIIPPYCNFSAKGKSTALHRHTSAEFLINCHTRQADVCLPPMGQKVTLPFYIPPSPENSEIIHLVRSIACAKTARQDRSYFEECGEFMLLIHKLCERVQSIGHEDTVSPGNRRHCARAKAFISENIHRHITVTEVAQAVGVSKNYMTNVFSRCEGLPLMEYINRSKLSYITVLIRRYDYTLAQAGRHVGMTDVNYISRIFKHYYGMTVTEYKRSLKRQDTPAE